MWHLLPPINLMNLFGTLRPLLLLKFNRPEHKDLQIAYLR
nr:hypothetical protein Q903MT_gene670 [Picea sitchensis]